MRASRDDVVAFRLHAHNLTKRLAQDEIIRAAAVCAIQNSPPGSALLALHARARDLSSDRLDHAVAADKSLLQTWCMRGSPFYIPTDDAPVFTTGVLPPTEEVMRQFILGAGPSVDKLGLSLTETVELIGSEIGDVLTGRQLAIDPLGKELAARIGPQLSPKQRDIWEAEGPHAAGQPLGEAIVHFCVRILTLQGIVCFAPRDGNKAPFVLVDEWLGHPIPGTDPETARADLLRRYLHSYGPSTRADFAAWLGVRAGDADSWWRLLEDEMTQVEFGRTTWLLTEDLDALFAPPSPEGVRLLPPRDPYTQLRDRDTIVDKKYHRDVWKTVGDPGTVLADGDIIGTWRARKSGRTLVINIKTFNALPAQHRKPLETEAERVATLRDAPTPEVQFDAY